MKRFPFERPMPSASIPIRDWRQMELIVKGASEPAG
jgi:hypothetical protein